MFSRNIFLASLLKKNINPTLIRHSSTASPKRTHFCGQLTSNNNGQEITVCGWLQAKRYSNFIILRDIQGTLQVCLDAEFFAKNPSFSIEDITNESVLAITGRVRKRPDAQINSAMKTGQVELAASQVKVLNMARDKLPFTISQHNRANEAVRMKYRYLDLRFSDMQKNLMIRSQFINECRQYLAKQGFIDIETPTLFRRTPGGAREFIVPTKQSEHFYCLTQSPQQFKQLLMVAGMDKYYQVARCYRDEATKPDRQPEFTQLDIEMSFIDELDVENEIEALLASAWPFEPRLSTPFRRMKYQNALTLYGNDKPDLRFDMKFTHVTDYLQSSVSTGITKLDTMKKSGKDLKAYAFKIDADLGLSEAVTYKKIEKEFQSLCKNAFANFPAGTLDKESLVFAAFDLAGSTGMGKHLTDEFKQGMRIKLGAVGTGDKIVMLAWENNEAKLLEILGKLRLNLADIIDKHNLEMNPDAKLLRDPKRFEFLWVTDFPLFGRDEVTGKIEATHHPFTAPIKEHEQMVREMKDLDKVIGLHYDLVLNGEEVAGGSIRIHEADLQRHVLENVLGEGTEQLGHLLEALEFGAPPHGGIALGLDRLTALMCGTENIRNVIAFPKAQSGKDVMSNAPAKVPQEELDYYRIKCVGE